MSEPNELVPRPEEGDGSPPGPEASADSAPKRRRRGSRGGRNRNRTAGAGGAPAAGDSVELPDRPNEGRPQTVEAAERALVRKPKIGDSRPAPEAAQADAPAAKT